MPHYLRSKTCHIICALCAVRRCCAELLCGLRFCSCWGTLSASIDNRPQGLLTLLS